MNRLRPAALALAALLACAGDSFSAPLRLSLDVRSNARLAKSLDEGLAAMQRAREGQICHPLTAAKQLATRPAFCQGNGEPAMLVTVVMRGRQIVRLVTTHGASIERPMAMGSVAKLAIGIPMLSAHAARAEDRWCQQAIPGLRNSNGFEGYADCTDPASTVPATAAIGSSNNLAVIWALGRIAPNDLRAELARAGLASPLGVSPAVAIALGMVPLTPRQLLECHESIATGRAARASIVDGRAVEGLPIARWCADAVSTAEARRFASLMLRAPLEGGTAAFLPSLGGGAEWLTAKTGTPATADALDTGKVIVGSLRVNGRRFSVLVGVFSPRPGWPLAKRLLAKDLAPLMRAVLRDIAAQAAAPHRLFLNGQLPKEMP